MRDNAIMEWVKTEHKPDTSAINAYFQKRLLPQQADALSLISITKDTFGNTVYTSRRKKEELLKGEHSSMLVVSPEGRSLLTYNPQLLSRLEQGDTSWEQQGEGDEGRIYKLPLKTKEGMKDYAVKYTFPITSEGQLGAVDIYTPGIDHMYVLQKVQQDDPLPGLHYAVPLLATLDVTVSPFVKDAVPSTTLYTRGSISEQAQDQLTEMVGKRTLGEMSTPFIRRYIKSTMDIKNKLNEWYRQAKQDLPLISHDLQFDSNSRNPFITSIADLHHLFKEVQENPSLLGEEQKEVFDQRVQECVTVTELVVGIK